MRKLLDRLSLNQKLLTLLVVNAVGFCVIALVASSLMSSVESRSRHANEALVPLNASLVRLQTTLEDLQDASDEVPGASRNTDLTPELEDVREELTRVGRLAASSMQAAVDRRSRIELFSRSLIPLSQKISRTVDQLTKGIIVADEKTIREISELVRNLDSFIGEMQAYVVESGIKNRRIAIGYTVLAAFLAFFAVAAFLWFVVLQNVTRPLHALTDLINSFNALGIVEENDFEIDLMQRNDELGRMSRSFNRLKHNLFAQREALQKSKIEAESANDAKSQFLAAASHDLRQPLHAMQIYISALRNQIDDPDALAVVEDIDAASISTARLLNALLDVSQLEAGAIRPTPEHYPLNEILRRVSRSFEPTARQMHLTLKFVKTSAFVYADPVLLERIVGNFTSNAVRYTHGGAVLIGCRRRKNNLSIEVLDTGQGIPEEEINAIFEDFYQIHNKERDRGKGLGLGLAIARRLATQMGCRIEYESVVGKGSRFAVIVPVGDPDQQKAQIEDPQASAIDRLQGVTVLLIEDDPVVMHASTQLMESWGCSVLTATTMDDAMAVLTRRENMAPEIIVADYRLPGGFTGVEAATHLQLMLGQAVPVIIVTGDVAGDPMRDIADQGYRLLSKPVRPAKLRALVSHLLGNR